MIDIVQKLSRKIFVLGLMFFTFSVAASETTVRQYGEVDSVKKGETKFRMTEAFPPKPYVATSPLALSFAPKFELPCESWDVAGLRINIFVGSHRAVYALDIGGIGNFADYKMDGIGIAGLFNSVGESDGAFQIAGIFNFAAFDFKGCQIAGIYSATEGTHCGLQVGLATYAGDLYGVQVGILNYAERLHGVQLGLINYNRSSPVALLPIVNVAF